MKKVMHYVWSVLEGVIIVYVIAMTLLLLCKNKYGYTQFGRYTFNDVDLVDERGIDGVRNGDLMIVENSNDIKEGDVIYYYMTYDDVYYIKSDTVTKVQTDGFTSLYTLKEDEANVASTRVLGKRIKTYSNIGKIYHIIQSRFGFLFFVLLPILVVFIVQIYGLFVLFKYEPVEEVPAGGKFQEVPAGGKFQIE